ncbi:MAG: acyl-CoA dehydrogenase family protein [Candidatus Binatus sp.]
MQMTTFLEEDYAHSSRINEEAVAQGPHVVARAAALRLKLRERTTETDRLARLPEATVADLEEARLFEITTPRRYGGLQLDVHAYMDAMVELGRGDASVSWVTTLVNINNWFIATLFPPEVSEEVFAKPGARVAAVLQPRKCRVRKVSGGFHIEEGIWAFNSGVYHAQWDMLGFPVHDETGISLVFALLPIADVQILDDWDTIGVRGSGSSSVAVRDVFVPDIRIVRADSAQFGKYKSTQLDREWFYRASFTALGQIIIAFPALGAGLGALDVFTEQLPRRAIAYSPYTKQQEAAVTHLQLGEASAKIDAARMIIATAADDVERYAKAGKQMDQMTQARIRRDTGFASRLIWEGIDILAGASGGSFAGVLHPLNRIWRDARVAGLHATLVPSTVYELYGRLMCGLEAWG